MTLQECLNCFVEEYQDEDYFSMDTDEQVDWLIAFAYEGTTAMKHSVLREAEVEAVRVEAVVVNRNHHQWI